MNRNKYNVEQAVQFILKPGDESELSDLDEDDDHNEISACNNHGVEIEDDIGGDDRREEQVNDNHERNISKEKVQDSTLNQPAKDTKFNDHNYRWRNVSPPVFDMSFGGEEFDVPPENFEELTPLNYFQMLWNKGLNKLIAEQTNLCSVQEDGKSIATSEDEIKQFISIQMLTSLVDLPSYMMYWAKETLYPQLLMSCL